MSADSAAASSSNAFQALDDSKISRFQIKTMFVSGMGFFTDAYDLLETVSAIAPSPPVPLETVIAEGDPTESMVEASKGANLLVMGIRGRSPFAGLLLGAVSQGAAANAHCPVVLVKRSDEAVIDFESGPTGSE